MKKEILRDNMLERLEKPSKFLDLACWTAIILAALYFGPTCFQILAR